MLALLTILGLVALLAFWFISVQRDLVSKDENCKNALSQIGVQQSSRWDALTALVELVKSYNEHEYNTLKDIIAVRSNTNANSSTEEVEAQEKAITSAMKSINMVVERYPELKANENYAKAMDSVNTYENQVRVSRMVYNDTVTIFNKVVRMFPSSFVASMLHFDLRQNLTVDERKVDMPSMKI